MKPEGGGVGKHEIVDIRATTVTMPLEAPLRHSNGAHWGRFVRTVVEVEADNGLIGLGEMGGGGQSAEAAVTGLKPYLVGHDPARTEALRWMIANPTASLYNNRTQLLAAIEFACLDLQGKQLGVPVHELLGGKVRDEVPFASYLFFRHPADDGTGEIRTAEQLVEARAGARRRARVQRAQAEGRRLPAGLRARVLPGAGRGVPRRTGSGTTRTAPSASRRRSGSPRGIEDLDNDYLEDPTWGLNGMRRVREKTSIPLATNTVVVNFEQLAANVRDPAVDVILLDTTFWGGIRPCIKAAGVCETFQLGVAVHSSGELGIQLATMLHLGAVVPNLSFAADAHYHHLRDDIIAGGKLPYADGAIAVPDGPGLGVELDRDKLAEYAELFRELGYPYDRDPAAGLVPPLPNTDWADPCHGRASGTGVMGP